MHRYFVYIMTNPTKTVLYVGMTNDIARRAHEHREGLADGFTKTYNAKLLVYAEETQYVDQAIAREKQLKKWRREKKERLINEMNPEWKDLYDTLA